MAASMTFIAASMTSHAGPHGVFMQERRRLAGWLGARPPAAVLGEMLKEKPIRR